MKTKLTMMVAMAAACAAAQLTATPKAEEAKRQVFSGMFPEWQVKGTIGIESGHRGQDNVAFVHPPSQQIPAVVSRTLTLSDGNPCLFLKIASFDERSDFLLSVLVDGKEVLPKRLIRTPDYTPWQDITIPLFAWRGSKVKIEIVITANNWWCEHSFFKRLEVAEGTGQEKFVPEAKTTCGGYTWSYRVDNGEATLVLEKDGNYFCAVSPNPKGKVSIPATLNDTKVTHIGHDAFKDCRWLTSVTIPKGVTSIGRAAFHSCHGLTSVTIPQSVQTIGGGTFWGCGSLEKVTIPEKVASIGNAVFSYCGKLQRINVNAGNQAFTSIDGVLYTKDRSVLVACPNAITSVKIPKSVTAIRTWALEGCGKLKSVTIPEGVKSIGGGAFKNCSALTSITMLGELPEVPKDPNGESLFRDCKKLTKIHVPAKAKSWAGMKDWLGVPLVFDAK